MPDNNTAPTLSTVDITDQAIVVDGVKVPGLLSRDIAILVDGQIGTGPDEGEPFYEVSITVYAKRVNIDPAVREANNISELLAQGVCNCP